MSIYYILLVAFSLFSVIEVNNQKTSLAAVTRTYVYVFCFIALFLLAGLKGNVGSDYLSYYYKYKDVIASSEYSWISGLEPGFWLWMKVCGCFGLSYVGFWALTAFVNIESKFYAFSRLSPYIALSACIYVLGLFFERDFDGVRQGLAIGISFLGLVAYMERQNKLFVILVTIACTIHYTSFLFYIIPLLNHSWNKKFMAYAIMLGCALVLLQISIFNLQGIVWGYDNMITARVAAYSGNQDYNSSVGLSIGILTRILFLYLFVRRCGKIVPETLFNILCNGFFLAIMASLVFNDFEIISHRMLYGFRELQIFIIPWIVASFTKKKERIFGTLLINLYCLVLLYRLLHSSMAPVYTYKTFFDENLFN